MSILPMRLLLFAADVSSLAPKFTGPQSALDPAGPQSARIRGLWSDYFTVSVVVFVLVNLAILLAVVLRSRRVLTHPILYPSKFGEGVRGMIVGTLIIATTAVLFFLLIDDHVVGRALRNLPKENAVKIRATGHQWWWEFRYDDPTPSNILETANEIHIPVGRPIEFELQSPDVIHSFWIPNLHGKRDMIPGHTTYTTMQADAPGTFWGQCAEFCGYEHALMRFKVVAEPEAEFQKWLAMSRQPAPEPTTETAKKGKTIFLSRTCVMCHTIQGSGAGGMIGPELTHIASRSHIGAGSFSNTRGYLGGWIANPQQLKPGVHMPPNTLAPDELQSLLDYLETLK